MKVYGILEQELQYNPVWMVVSCNTITGEFEEMGMYSKQNNALDCAERFNKAQGDEGLYSPLTTPSDGPVSDATGDPQ